jgi:hypothetical protein
MENAMLMSRLSIAATMSVFTFCTANAADNLRDQHKIHGQVPQLCFLPSSQPHDVDFIQAGAVSFTDGTAEAVQLFQVEYVNAKCNFAPFIKISSENGGATRNAVLGTALPAPAPGFTNRIDYRVTATWGDMTTTLVTSGQPASVEARDTQTARMGDVNLVVQSLDGTVPIEAGYYEDKLTIEFGEPD